MRREGAVHGANYEERVEGRENSGVGGNIGRGVSAGGGGLGQSGNKNEKEIREHKREKEGPKTTGLGACDEVGRLSENGSGTAPGSWNISSRHPEARKTWKQTE